MSKILGVFELKKIGYHHNRESRLDSMCNIAAKQPLLRGYFICLTLVVYKIGGSFLWFVIRLVFHGAKGFKLGESKKVLLWDFTIYLA